MSMLFPIDIPDPRGVPSGMRALLGQGKWWKTRDRGWMKIKNMTPEHRRHAAALMHRRASLLAERLNAAEDETLLRLAGSDVLPPDEVLDDIECTQDRRTCDPEGWIESTELYRSLIRPRKRDTERFGGQA